MVDFGVGDIVIIHTWKYLSGVKGLVIGLGKTFMRWKNAEAICDQLILVQLYHTKTGELLDDTATVLKSHLEKIDNDFQNDCQLSLF